MTHGPTAFEVYESGALLDGTKAPLAVGDLLVPAHLANFERDARRCGLGAELAAATAPAASSR